MSPDPSVPGSSVADALQNAFISVAERVSPSVVAVRVESRRKLPNPFQGFPFGHWFGLPNAQPHDEYQVQRGTGSGVIVGADGYVLTNRHVVDKAGNVEVILHDQRRFPAKAVGVDEATDLAVLKIDAKNLPAAVLADSSKALPGQWVIAIGSPFGLDNTVTVGVVSATGRGGMGMNEIEDYLQTDASINPGNSGGPLVNLRGEVLGINTMIVGPGTGIGFAIPSNLVRNVVEQLVAHGKVHRAYIGVTFQELTPELAQHFGLSGKPGALVSSVAKDGPAQRAGVRPGDVIVSVDGKALIDSRDLLRRVLTEPVGAKLTLGVVREGKPLELSVVTADRPREAKAGEPDSEQPAAPSSQARELGLQLQSLNPALAAPLGYQGLSGALVTGVEPGSVADRSGLQQGDLIVEADHHEVKSPSDVDAALADGSALLRVRRRDAALYIVLSKAE